MQEIRYTRTPGGGALSSISGGNFSRVGPLGPVSRPLKSGARGEEKVFSGSIISLCVCVLGGVERVERGRGGLGGNACKGNNNAAAAAPKLAEFFPKFSLSIVVHCEC